MSQSNEELKKEIRGQIVARLNRARALEAFMSDQNAPIQISTRRATWKNLYPDFKKRVLAYTYSWLHAIAPKYFVTVTFDKSWITDFFPFKREMMFDDLAEVQQERFNIEFADHAKMLMDISMTPVKPIDAVNIAFVLDEPKD